MRTLRRHYLPIAALIGLLSCADTTKPSATISVSPTTQSVPAGGGTFTVNVTSNSSWTVTSDASWVTVSGGSGSNNGAATYTVAANSGSAARTARLTAVSGSVSAALTVTEDGVTSAPQLTVTPAAQSVVAGGESRTVTVSGNVVWTAASDAAWVTITSGASGTGNGTIAYTAAANSGAPRSAHVTVSGGGLTAVHTVNQSGVAVLLSVTPQTQNVAAAGESKTATVTANVAWTAASDSSWLTITSGSFGASNGTIAYTAAANPGGAARTGVITVTGGGASATHTVTQAGVGPTLSVTPPAQSVVAGGESKTAAVTANIAWTASSDSTWLTITSGSSGTNNGTIAYTAAPNSGTSSRAAVITVIGSGLTAIHRVTQAGSSAVAGASAGATANRPHGPAR